MSKKQTQSGQRWTPAEVKQLKELVAQNTPTPVIGSKLSRSESAIRAKAQSEGVSLKPTNRSPYGKQK